MEDRIIYGKVWDENIEELISTPSKERENVIFLKIMSKKNWNYSWFSHVSDYLSYEHPLITIFFFYKPLYH